MLTTFLGWLLTLLTGPAVDKVLGHLERKAENETEREKVRTMAQLQVIKLTLADRQDQRRSLNEVRLATAGFWEMRLLTFLIAMPFVWHVWSVWLDTQFKLGWRIDKFPEPFDQWEGTIILSFFGAAVVSTGLKSIAGAVAINKR
jgi:hypothetical protein